MRVLATYWCTSSPPLCYTGHGNILDIHGKITSLYNKTNLRQAANLVLRGYKAPHLLGEAANPLFLMFQY